MYTKHLADAELRNLGLEVVDLTSRGTVHAQRRKAPPGLVYHSPGRTWARKVLARLTAKLNRTPTLEEFEGEAAVSFDVLQYQPGRLVGVTGRVFVLDRDDRRTHHAGTLGYECPEPHIYARRRWREWAKIDGKWKMHRRDGDRVFDWWDAAFDADSPVGVFPWGQLPNDALGLDLLPNVLGDGGFTDAQRQVAPVLVRALAGEHGFKPWARTVATHSLVAPCERGTQLQGKLIIGVPWDPPPQHWDHAKFLADISA